MEPRIEFTETRKLIGQRSTMSLANDRTFELWKNFMPKRKGIQNIVGTDLFSMQLLHPSYFENFNPAVEFEKWAVVEVSTFDIVPVGMESFTLPAGIYAVFIHKGDAHSAPVIFNYIFKTWLPNSGYILDNRPHFELLGEKYRNNDPGSEEEIWIPVKPNL